MEDTSVLSDSLRARHEVLHHVASGLALAAGLVALISIVAWFAGIQSLLILFHGAPPMKINSAVSIWLAALSLLLQWRTTTPARHRMAVICAAMAAGVGALTLLQYFTHTNLGIDELLVRDRLTPLDQIPGRPGFDAALSLLSLGLALALLDYPRLRPLSHALAVIAGVFPYFALLGYVFGAVIDDSTNPYSPMAMVTAFCLGLLSTATLLARTDGPVIRELVNFNRYIAASWVVLLALLIATGWNWWSARVERARSADAAFAYETMALRMRLLARFSRNEVMLTSGRALFNASSDVSREEWSRFVATMHIADYLPGMLGLGYAAHVTPAQSAMHVATVRKDLPDYQIWPEGEREFYGPIVYLEPFPDRNRRAIGYDMYSEPPRRAAMQRAMDAGSSALSQSVRLVQENKPNAQPGFLIYAPLYRDHVIPASVAERREKLLGWIYSPFLVTDFMRATLDQPAPRVTMEIHDGSDTTPANLLFRPEGQAFDRAARFRSTEIVRIAGHSWTLTFVSLPNFEASLIQRTPEYILYGGTIISLLIFATALALITARRRAQALADRKTLELRLTNEQLVRQTRELERSNAELEQFAYVASHDLREPLRTVTSFTQLLEEEHSDKLPTDARRYMKYIVDGNRRMKQLIDDLLSLSRAGSRSMPMDRVLLQEAVGDALFALSHSIDESGSVVEYVELPTVLGDRMQLVQLFQNLIANALKFKASDIPRIRISARRDEEWWQVSVQDNGIGIDRKYFDRIFVIFQRLHGREEYSGNGIGLAICKKIVERHGGLIWVESEVGRGATFHFTLRAA